jgi:hypothetical protein
LKQSRFFNMATIIFTLISAFIVYTTLFTNLYNNTLFSFWYWPGAIILFITLALTIISIYFGKHTVLYILLFILNIIMLVIFTAPIILA